MTAKMLKPTRLYPTKQGENMVILSASLDGMTYEIGIEAGSDSAKDIARRLLPGSAAIVADPYAMLDLIMEYALVFGDQDMDLEILAKIKAALGIEGT